MGLGKIHKGVFTKQQPREAIPPNKNPEPIVFYHKNNNSKI